jgi:transitional endoplasmic reticulum ATPase
MRTGRLDYIFKFSVPDEKDRLEIFQVHTREKPLGSDVDLVELAKATEGMVGSQIASICRNAAMMAVKEMIGLPEKKSASRLLIRSTHFKEAIGSVRTSEGNA